MRVRTCACGKRGESLHGSAAAVDVAMPAGLNAALISTAAADYPDTLMNQLAQNKIGKYDVIRKLGDGATSTVYLANDEFNCRDVAIKLVSQSALKDDTRGQLMHHLFMT